MNTLRVRAVSIVLTIGAGAALGLLGPVSEKFSNPVCQAVGVVFTGGWPWACFAFMVGYFRRSWIEAVLVAPPALATGVVVYYLAKALHPTGLGNPIHGSAADISPMTVVWCIGAVVLGVPLGAIGYLAATPGIAGLSFRLLIPVIAFMETGWRLDTAGGSESPVASVTWGAVHAGAVAVAVALVGHTVWNWRARRSQPDGRAKADV
ncbi:hypothetical protein ACIQ9Q_09550 [Streptomyces sp. NPDC094438]|uniref:hypothetical protein n=1 Tax=Streptomyces sp. NPDC094438 TaxID=3366061 RepID=UPI0038037B1C